MRYTVRYQIENMKKKKWVLVGLVICMSLIGCRGKEDIPSSTPLPETPVAASKPIEEAPVPDSLLPDNEAYRRIDTKNPELGMVINEPTKEIVEQVSKLDNYKDDITGESILIVPKYKHSKIEVLPVAYEGETLVIKEALYEQKETPEGFGLLIETQRPEGIPRLLVRMSYLEEQVDYFLSPNLKDGEQAIEYLRVPEDEGEGELIEATEDSQLFKGLHLINEVACDLDQDGQEEAKLLLYSEALLNKQGLYELDDGQKWLLAVQVEEAIYPLFGPEYIQLGTLKYTLYADYTQGRLGVLINSTQGAGIKLYECTYDQQAKGFRRALVYQTVGNIGILQEWNK